MTPLQATIFYLFLLVLIYPSQSINTFIESTGANGEDIWSSTSAFIPQQSQDFGTIKIGQIMTIEFDFVFNGRTNNPTLYAAENFLRIGHAAGGGGCNETHYPSIWLKPDRQSTSPLMVKTTSGETCEVTHHTTDYGNLAVDTSMHIKIAMDHNDITLDITGGGKADYTNSFTRSDILKDHLGVSVPVWWMSDTAGSLYNLGDGTFSNVLITSEVFTFAPTPAPTTDPTEAPSTAPTQDTVSPTSSPSDAPSLPPTPSPTDNPTQPPTPAPTDDPSPSPTDVPTPSPSDDPTPSPTDDPTPAPTDDPSSEPSIDPTPAPTDDPTAAPSTAPSDIPSTPPSSHPTSFPTSDPTFDPTTNAPTTAEPTPVIPTTSNPSVSPTTETPTTTEPTLSPSNAPTQPPTQTPSFSPSDAPSSKPTQPPTQTPSSPPTSAPTLNPTSKPSSAPTNIPSDSPTNKGETKHPSVDPTDSPSKNPTDFPTTVEPTTTHPTKHPTSDPTTDPTDDPTKDPTINPTTQPIHDPTTSPSEDPTTESPTTDPTDHPTRSPTDSPTEDPTEAPSQAPTAPTDSPSDAPTTTTVMIYVTEGCDEGDEGCSGQQGSTAADPYTYTFYGAIVCVAVFLVILAMCCYCKFKPPKEEVDFNFEVKGQSADGTAPKMTVPMQQRSVNTPVRDQSYSAEEAQETLPFNSSDEDVLGGAYGGRIRGTVTDTKDGLTKRLPTQEAAAAPAADPGYEHQMRSGGQMMDGRMVTTRAEMGIMGQYPSDRGLDNMDSMQTSTDYHPDTVTLTQTEDYEEEYDQPTQTQDYEETTQTQDYDQPTQTQDYEPETETPDYGQATETYEQLTIDQEYYDDDDEDDDGYDPRYKNNNEYQQYENSYTDENEEDEEDDESDHSDDDEDQYRYEQNKRYVRQRYPAVDRDQEYLRNSIEQEELRRRIQMEEKQKDLNALRDSDQEYADNIFHAGQQNTEIMNDIIREMQHGQGGYTPQYNKNNNNYHQ